MVLACVLVVHSSSSFSFFLTLKSLWLPPESELGRRTKYLLANLHHLLVLQLNKQGQKEHVSFVGDFVFRKIRNFLIDPFKGVAPLSDASCTCKGSPEIIRLARNRPKFLTPRFLFYGTLQCLTPLGPLSPSG